MYLQLLIFIACAYVFLFLTRLGYSLWLWPRVKAAGGLVPVLFGGLRVDTAMLGMVTALPLLLAPWFNNSPAWQLAAQIWLSTAWLLIVLLEVSTPQFIIEYETRPNRLYIDYLKHPKEVGGMLLRGYKALIVIGVGVVVGLTIAGVYAFAPPIHTVHSFSWWQALLLSLLAAAICFLAIRGTLHHRPLNPATVTYCGDSLLNTLPLNSIYSVCYAVYCIKNERSAAEHYGKMPAEIVHKLVLEAANIQTTHPDIPSLHTQTSKHPQKRPKNIVIIVEESLGAQFVSSLGGKDLCPNLDALNAEGWCFTQAYATGTRSVRGLEALSAGFPPTVSDAVVRLSGSQTRFFTLAQALKNHGYHSHFIYGGEAHFDNMKSYFMGNGFDSLHEQHDFTDPAFVGTWGASDEDMFNKLHEILGSAHETPTLSLAFSVSNHSPWEYPKGRITPIGEPASVENTVRYADWAIGNFFAKAKESDYWKDTVFLVVADHDARVGGASLVPLRHFHIPAVIVGGGITPRVDDRLISQIDLPVTLLSLAGVSSEHPMIGHDLTDTHFTPRAMMQYSDNYGYLEGDILTVLEPGKQYSQYHYVAPDSYTPLNTPNQRLIDLALAHALWPTMVYRERRYTLPELRATLSEKDNAATP